MIIAIIENDSNHTPKTKKNKNNLWPTERDLQFPTKSNIVVVIAKDKDQVIPLTKDKPMHNNHRKSS